MSGYRVGRKPGAMKTQPIGILRTDTARDCIDDFACQESTKPKKEISMNNNKEDCRPAFVYVRSATDNGDSLADQVERCRQYARQKGFSVSEECIFRDRAVSGNTLNRPGLNALMSLIRTEETSPNDLIARDPARLARNTNELLKLLKMLRKKGIAVHFAEGDLVSLPRRRTNVYVLHKLVGTVIKLVKRIMKLLKRAA